MSVVGQMTPEEAVALHRDALAHDILPIWTVTAGTNDFGRRYVARPHFVGGRASMRGPGPAGRVQAETFVSRRYLIADTLAGLRALLPPGLYRMDRDDADDPVIVETWI